MVQQFLFYAAAFVVVLSVIVFIHEYGHYLVARLCGVRVEMFSIGFGKEIAGFNDKHGTRWKICLIPMGGYVKMFGDVGPVSTPDVEAEAHYTPEQRAEAFHYKPLYKKAAIVFAGPAANFILSIAALTFLFAYSGMHVALPIVAQIVPGSAAERAGVAPKDEFLSLDGKTTENFDDIRRHVMLNLGTEVTALIKRGEQIVTLKITPDIKERTDVFGNVIKSPVIGVMSDPAHYAYHRLSPIGAFRAAGVETWRFVTSTLTAVGQMVTGRRDLSEISGPIGIAKYSGQSAKQGWKAILWFIAVLSANLGLVNLFPVPALDGGHLAYYAIEALRGKPLADRYQELGIKAGIALISVFAIFAVYNDIRKLF
jgi:regulator of sigma E protease